MGHRVTVILIDDQPSLRRQLSHLLTHAGVDVVAEAGDIPKDQLDLETVLSWRGQ